MVDVDDTAWFFSGSARGVGRGPGEGYALVYGGCRYIGDTVEWSRLRHHKAAPIGRYVNRCFPLPYGSRCEGSAVAACLPVRSPKFLGVLHACHSARTIPYRTYILNLMPSRWLFFFFHNEAMVLLPILWN